MNFDVLGQKPIRIMWSQRDPGLRKSGVGNIFIKNLDKTIDNKVMYDTFSTFGNILSCKVAQDEHGNSRGYGFVHFETEEAANNAIAKVNEMLLNDKQVFVGRFLPRKEREKILGERAKRFTNVFVKNFGDEIKDDEQLKKMFEEFGTILSAKIAKDDKDTKSRGFGFVAFEKAEDAEAAVEKMNGKEIGKGMTLYVGRAQKKAERQVELRKKFEEQKAQRLNNYTGVNLYVKNLDDGIDDERLRQEFQAFGNITSAKVMTDGNGRSKGFGFVCFSTAEEATKAVTDMNGKIVVAKPLYVALAQRKDDRRQHLLTQQYRRASQMATTRQPPAGGPGGMHHIHHAPMPANPMMAQQPLNPMSAQAGVPGVGPAHNPYMAMNPNFGPYQKFSYPAHPMQPRQRWAPPQQMPRPQYLLRTNVAGGPRGPAVPGQRTQAPVQSGRPIVSQGRTPNRHMQPQMAGARPPVQVMNQANVPYKYGPGYMPPNSQMQGNAPQPQQQANIPPQQQPNAVNIKGHEPLTAKMLAGADPSQQKNMLGERLYPLIERQYPDKAGKITGMLLEIDNSEILHMLEHPESLNAKVLEAAAVLNENPDAKAASAAEANANGNKAN